MLGRATQVKLAKWKTLHQRDHEKGQWANRWSFDSEFAEQSRHMYGDRADWGAIIGNSLV